MVRFDPDGTAWTRSSSHGHWQSCKSDSCRDRWLRAGGWTRVSRGSHAGHIPERRVLPRPRTCASGPPRAEGLRFVPLESLDRDAYRRLDSGIAPPWEKETWRDLEHGRP